MSHFIKTLLRAMFYVYCDSSEEAWESSWDDQLLVSARLQLDVGHSVKGVHHREIVFHQF